MKFLFKIKNYLLIICATLWCCMACAKTPPVTEQSCEGFKDFVKMTESEDMLNLAPDAFIIKYKNLLSVSSDKVNNIASQGIGRDLIFKAAKGNWLVKAEANYADYDLTGPNKPLLTTADFIINPTCLPHANELDALLSKTKLTNKSLAQAPKEESYWERDNVDPEDEDSRKYTIFRTYENENSVQIGRRPNTGDESE